MQENNLMQERTSSLEKEISDIRSSLDDSHLQVSDTGGTEEWDYSLSGDMLTVTVRGDQWTFQKTG